MARGRYKFYRKIYKITALFGILSNQLEI